MNCPTTNNTFGTIIKNIITFIELNMSAGDNSKPFDHNSIINVLILCTIYFTLSKTLMRMKMNLKKTKWFMTMKLMVKVKMMMRNDCLKFFVTWIANLYH